MTIEARDIRQRRLELESAYQRHSELIHTRDQLLEDIARLDLQISITHRERLRHQIESVVELRDQIDRNKIRLTELGAVVEFPLELQETVNRLSLEWTGYSRSLAQAKTEFEAARPEAVELQRRRNELLQIIGPLENTRGISIEEESQIRELESRWREAVSAVGPLQKSLDIARAAVTELESVRESAARRPVVGEPALQSLHDLGVRWETAEHDRASAETDFGKTQETFLSSVDSLEKYEALDATFSAMTPFIISDFKKLETNHGEMEEKLRLAAGSQPGRALWLAALLGGFAGALALILGLTRGLFVPVLAGGSLMAVAAFAFALVMQRQRRFATARSGAAKAAEALKSQLDQYGFESVSEFERAYTTYLAAQAPHFDLVRSRATVEEKHTVVTDIHNRARELLGLSLETPISLDILRAAENDVRQLTAQLTELHRREQRRDQLAPDLRDAMNQLSQAEKSLQTALQAVGVEAEDLSQSASRYYELCNKRHLLEKADIQLEATDAKLERFTQVATAARNAAIGMNSTEAELQRILRRAGIDEPATEQALQVFELNCDRAKTALRIREEVANQSRELAALLGAQSLDELNRRRAELSARVDAVVAAHAEWAGMIASDSSDALERQLAKSRDQVANIHNELATIEERLANGLRGFRALVDVEEEIDATEQTIATLAWHGEALQLAEQHLSAAADEHHRNFLPRLNQLVGQSVRQVTGGRYGNLQIDHSDLQVRLQVPNLLRTVTPEVLSRGAQEQIYLMLRLGLTELMSTGRERLPLILDDPLVNYDRERLQHGLDFLIEMAERGQVLLFTKDDETVRWFQAYHNHSDMHKLHTL